MKRKDGRYDERSRNGRYLNRRNKVINTISSIFGVVMVVVLLWLFPSLGEGQRSWLYVAIIFMASFGLMWFLISRVYKKKP